MTIYRGTVTRASAAGLWVTIDPLGSTQLGPLDHLAGRIANHQFTDNDTGTGAGGSATETLTHAQRINVGDRVLVVDLGTDDYLVLGRIVTGVPA